MTEAIGANRSTRGEGVTVHSTQLGTCLTDSLQNALRGLYRFSGLLRGNMLETTVVAGITEGSENAIAGTQFRGQTPGLQQIPVQAPTWR